MKFYKLSELDLPLIVSLNESEIKVWCWLSINLPFENSKNLEIDTSQLAEELSMSRRSVQRALKKLQEDEIFDIEFTKAKVKRKTSQMSSNDTDVVETSQMSPKRHRCRQRKLKPLQNKPFKTLRSFRLIQTLKRLSQMTNERDLKIFASRKFLNVSSKLKYPVSGLISTIWTTGKNLRLDFLKIHNHHNQ